MGLSQAEIDALLKSNSVNITDDEIDTLGEIGNISMGTAATTLYEILGKRVDITTPKVSVTTMRKMAETYHSYVGIEVSTFQVLKGFIPYSQNGGRLIITDLLMGGDGTNREKNWMKYVFPHLGNHEPDDGICCNEHVGDAGH